jgi:hypothetical protein
MYEFVQTPFASSERVPKASVAGGRLQLFGYHCLASSENFQMGLPGGGVFPATGIGRQSHPLILVPQNNESGGFNITFTLHATDTAAIRIHPLETVNHAVNFLRRI